MKYSDEQLDEILSLYHNPSELTIALFEMMKKLNEIEEEDYERR